MNKNELEDKNIVIVVDLQKGFLDKVRDKSVCSTINAKLLMNIHAITTMASSIIATLFINNKTDNNFHNILGYKEMNTPNEQWLNNVLYTDNLTIIKKTQYGFDDNKYLTILKKANGGRLPKKVYLCGLDIDGCVLAIAHQLFAHNIQPILIKDATYSSGGSKIYFDGLSVYKRTFGKKSVISISEYYYASQCGTESKANKDVSQLLSITVFNLEHEIKYEQANNVCFENNDDIDNKEIFKRIGNGENKPIDQDIDEQEMEDELVEEDDLTPDK